MSRYMITQDQLERLQEQIQELRRVNAVKDERIRALELHKHRVSNADVTELLKTIAILEEDISELKSTNRRLSAEAESFKADATRMRDMEALLREERKLRQYSEALASEMEQVYNEEVLLKNLTTELCQLQKTEIEIGNKRIEDLQKKLRRYSNVSDTFARDEYDVGQVVNGKRRESILRNSMEKENIAKSVQEFEYFRKKSEETDNDTNRQGKTKENKQLKFIVQNLRKQMTQMYEEIEKKPVKTEADRRRLHELNKWFKETEFVMEDVKDIEQLKKDLRHLRDQIENRRNSISKFRSAQI